MMSLIRKVVFLYCLFLTGSASAQDSFEKFYNKQSDIYNNFSTEKQNSTEGLDILLEIEAQFNKLSPVQHKKFIRRMGDTFVGVSSIYAAQNNPGKAIEYMQKAFDARDGDIDPKYIARVKDFDNVRNLPEFKKIVDNFTRGKKPEIAVDFNTKVSSKNLKKDLAILKESLEEAHQGLYQYRTKKEIDELFTNAVASVNGPMTAFEFYQLIAPVVAAINDGHTQIVTPSAPAAAKNKIPLGLTVIDNRLYISKSYVPACDKMVGMEIESINNQPAAAIIQFALTNYSSDGENITHKLFSLSKPSRISDILMLMAGQNEKFSLAIKRNPQPVVIEGITRDSLNVLSMQTDKDLIRLEFLDTSSTAIITAPSFSASLYARYSFNMKAFLQKTLNEIAQKKTKNLIIDVRGNGGGEDAFGRMLYACFAEKDFTYYQSITIAKNSFKLFDYVEGGDQLKMPEDFAVKNQSGSFDVTKKYNSNIGLQQPMLPRFAGNIYILIDGGCFSTTSEFLSQMHANTKAVFIGEESGGNYYTDNSGINANIVLPNSKLQVNIPMLKYTISVPEGYAYRNHGIIPKYPVSPTLKDRLESNDPELAKAMELIKEQQ
jgi:C-terminal processing protease CtpA/Prc